MNQLLLLDCTLRDGGYVNNWRFGRSNIERIVSGLELTGVSAIELGFLRDEPNDIDSSNLHCIEDADSLLNHRKSDIIYSAMLEAFNPFPLSKLTNHREHGIDLIRICVWKRCIKEHLDYCKAVKDKGYKITIQPSRVEQYNDFEFVDLLKRADDLLPYAVYVVDTWGTQSATQICHYLELADKYLSPNVKVGYHGHNNKLQALSCAHAAIEMKLDRDLFIDCSVMGMGRGAGNLNTEIIMDYLNEYHEASFNVDGVVELYNASLKEVYHQFRWGYSMYYYLCSTHNCNPNYATFFSDHSLGEDLFSKFLSSLSEEEKVVYNEELIKSKLACLL